jgi:hypothetical protein
MACLGSDLVIQDQARSGASVRSLIMAALDAWHDFVMTNQLILRPVSEDDLPLLQTLTQDPEATGEFGWFGWFNRRRWRRGWDENGRLYQGRRHARCRLAGRRLARRRDLQHSPERPA